MRLDNMVVVAKREYLQRIKSKGFWIATLILPLFASAVTILPSLLVAKMRSTQTIAVVDESPGQAIAQDLRREMAQSEASQDEKSRDRQAHFEVTPVAPEADRAAQRKALDDRVKRKELDAWLWIGPDVLAGKPAEYHARNTANVMTQQGLERDLSTVVGRARLQQAGIDPQKVHDLTKRVDLDAVSLGTGGGGGTAGLLFAMLLFFILYIAMLSWGQQVMQGVLDEKGSRVIEVVISAVTPFELMLGKLVGICLVGLTQLGIWLGTVLVLTSPGIAASMALLPGGKMPSLSLVTAVHFVLLFILGFFAFATFYAAIGAAFNNLQEAQQAASIAMVFIITPAMIIFPVINDPNSKMATILSLIPTFTPLLMPLRIAIEMPPLWQIALAYALTIGFVIAMVWFCARIYRVGILMYGKKPTFAEIWKWTRYA